MWYSCMCMCADVHVQRWMLDVFYGFTALAGADSSLGWILNLWGLPGFAHFPCSRMGVLRSLVYVHGTTPNFYLSVEI